MTIAHEIHAARMRLRNASTLRQKARSKHIWQERERAIAAVERQLMADRAFIAKQLGRIMRAGRAA